MTLSRRTRSRLNLTFPLLTTLILMVLLVIYTSRMFYRITVSNIYEVGEDKISGVSASLGNYMDTAKSVMWVTADTIDFMKSKGTSNKVILDYLKLETQKHKSQFDKNYTGLYGYISGQYLDADLSAVAGKCFVYGVIHYLINKVMKSGRSCCAYIHSGALAHSFKTFQYLYIAGVVALFVFDLFCHIHIFIHCIFL